MDTEAEEYHVLAVDDSIIDRKLIERLLKTSSYQGQWIIQIGHSSIRFPLLLKKKLTLFWVCIDFLVYCSDNS